MRFKYYPLVLLFFINFSACKTEVKDNTLSRKEIKEGWKLLFDGQNTNGWRGFRWIKCPQHGKQLMVCLCRPVRKGHDNKR